MLHNKNHFLLLTNTPYNKPILKQYPSHTPLSTPIHPNNDDSLFTLIEIQTPPGEPE